MKPETNPMKPLAPRIATFAATTTTKPLRVMAAFIVLASLGLSSALAQTAGSELPTGFADIKVAAGTGTAKKTTLISIPLLEDLNITGSKSGRITGVTSNTITVSGAGWTPGALSAPAAPFLIEITSGAATGRLLLISTSTANTIDTLTIDAGEISRVGHLTSLGIATDAGTGDTFRLWPGDTMGSFFGTPETTGIQGGATSAAADTVTLVVSGNAATYFYNTAATPPRWSRVGPNADSSNIPLLPYAGIQYSRLAATPLEFRVLGRMPVGTRRVAIKNSGSTLLAPYWPVNQTLSGLGLHNLPGWQSSTNSSSADTVVLTLNGSASTYYHDGTNWRRVGLGGGNANGVVVPVGTSVMINKRGTATGFTTYQHNAPYSFQ